MKDFINWLRNNDKIGKVVIWLFIITIGLIIINTALTSLGLPHYQITEENLTKIQISKVYEYLVNWVIIILNFYATVLLVFRIKESKKIFKYAIIYLVFDIIIANLFGTIALNIYIVLYLIIFGYLYSSRNKKYILYMIGSLIINALIQGLTYTYKVKLIDYSSINYAIKLLLFSDYCIIMAIIILVKEYYLKKRGDEVGRQLSMVRPIQKRSNNSQKTSTKSRKSKKITKT